MWLVDIVVDFTWFVEQQGKLGDPKSRSRQAIPEQDFDNEFLLYGDELAIRHLRVLLHTDPPEPPNDVINANVMRWVDLLGVASGMAGPATATTASLGPNSARMMVMVSQGDESTNALHIVPKFIPPAPVDYDGAARIMAGWKPDFRAHLFYLSRFLNHQHLPEVRWLNGYRALEWHFRRGKAGLAKDPAYLAFLARHGQAFDALLGTQQDRKGVIEEVRAIVAHAILARTEDPRTENASTNLVLKTFPALEVLVMALINEEGLLPGLSAIPRPLPVPPEGSAPL